MTRKELEAAKAAHLQSIEAIDQQIRDIDAERKGWEPKDGEEWYYLASWGKVEFGGNWAADAVDVGFAAANNCFPTERAAERELLRRQSMKPTIPVPKVGDTVWAAKFVTRYESLMPRPHTWENCPLDFTAYYQGALHATEEECQAWIDQFGPAWTEGVEE